MTWDSEQWLCHLPWWRSPWCSSPCPCSSVWGLNQFESVWTSKKTNFQVIRFFHRSPAQGSICCFFVCISAVSSQIAVEALAKSAKPAETKNGPKKNSSRITTRAAWPAQAAGEASDWDKLDDKWNSWMRWHDDCKLNANGSAEKHHDIPLSEPSLLSTRAPCCSPRIGICLSHGGEEHHYDVGRDHQDLNALIKFCQSFQSPVRFDWTEGRCKHENRFSWRAWRNKENGFLNSRRATVHLANLSHQDWCALDDFQQNRKSKT